MEHLTALKVFRNVVELGSFAKASRAMGLSPAAVSKNIQELEAHLGVRLLNRTTRRLSRTDAGLRFFERVVRILDELREAEEELSPLQTMPQGTLRVTAPSTFTLVCLSGLIPEFLRRYPDIRLDLNMDSRRIDIIEEGYDVAIRISDKVVDSSLIARKLLTMQSVVTGSPGYFAKRGMPETPADLRQHDCVQFTLSGHVNEWEFRKAGEVVRIPIDGRYRVTSSLAVRDALVAGFGVSLLPRIYIGTQHASGVLQTVLDDWKAVETTLYALYPTKRYIAPKVRAFVDFLSEQLGHQARAQQLIT